MHQSSRPFKNLRRVYFFYSFRYFITYNRAYNFILLRNLKNKLLNSRFFNRQNIKKTINEKFNYISALNFYDYSFRNLQKQTFYFNKFNLLTFSKNVLSYNNINYYMYYYMIYNNLYYYHGNFLGYSRCLNYGVSLLVRSNRNNLSRYYSFTDKYILNVYLNQIKLKNFIISLFNKDIIKFFLPDLEDNFYYYKNLGVKDSNFLN